MFNRHESSITKHIRPYFFVFVFFICCIVTPSTCFNPNDIPEPLVSPEKCGRPGVQKSRICDMENLLTKDSKDVIEGYINSIDAAEVAVVVVSHMSASFIGLDFKGAAAQRFATQLHNLWKVGNIVKQNGIMLFVSINDREVFISTGAGVMNRLTRVVIGTIIEHMRPKLRQKRYGEAIEMAILEMRIILSDQNLPIATDSALKKVGVTTSGSSPPHNFDKRFVANWLLPVVSIGLLGNMIASIARFLRNSQFNAGEEALREFLREINNVPPAPLEVDTMDMTLECPSCGHVFLVPPNDVSSSAVSSGDVSGHIVAEDASNSHMNVCPKCQMTFSITRGGGGGGGGFLDKKKNGRRQQPRGFGFGLGRNVLHHPTGTGMGTGMGGSPSASWSSPHHYMPRPPVNSEHTEIPIPSSAVLDPVPSHSLPRGMDDASRARALLELERLRREHPAEAVSAETHAHLQEAVQKGSPVELPRVTEIRLEDVSRAMADVSERLRTMMSGQSGFSGSASFGGGSSSGGGGGSW